MAARGKTDAEQRRALLVAMAALVARDGYHGVRTADLASAARVSSSTLYLRFGSKESCFLAVIEEVVGKALSAVGEAAECGQGPQARLRAALDSLFDLTHADPAAAHLVLVDALALGAAGLSLRRSGTQRFEAIVARVFCEEGMSVAPTVARAIVAGIGGVLRRRLLRGELSGLAGAALPLVRWALRLADEQEVPRLEPPVGFAEGAGGVAVRSRGEFPWACRPGAARARALLSRRERFLRAAAWVTMSRGYGALSIPAISTAAGSSNEVFYGSFRDKREPLYEAFGLLAGRMVAACRDTEAPPTVTGAASAAIEALRGEGSAAAVFARLAFIELPSIGEEGMGRAEEALDALANTLLSAVPVQHPLAAEADRDALIGLLEASLLPAL